jgi:cytochrome c peroxidase
VKRFVVASVIVCSAAALAVALAAAPAAPVSATSAAKGEAFASGDYRTVLPLGLQATSAYVPDNNPMSAKKIELGRMLYFDKRLSSDGSVACVTCHDPGKGFSDNRSTSAGIHGKTGVRNAPTVINRLFSADQFWDGRAADLEAQALGPVQNPIEMGNTLDGMIANVRGITAYAPYFQAAFGTAEINPERVSQAIATYERTVVSGDAPYDRYQAGDKTALSPAAQRGLALFNDTKRGNCVTCHAGFNFSDESYHNLGIGMDKEKPDLGRYEITKVETDRGAFKTPTLRNLTETAPYMHDGSETTLEEVVDLYVKGGVPNQWLSKEMHPVALNASEKADLVAFLKSLTGKVGGAGKPKTLPGGVVVP